jgi:hypothetical protein
MKITSKQQKLAETYLKAAGNAKAVDRKELMLKVGYSRSTAEKKTAEVFKSPGFLAALEEMGVNGEKIVKTINNALEARLTSTYRGGIVESDEPDHQTRLKAANSLADLLGLKHKKTVHLSRTENISVSIEEISHLF